MNKALDLHHSFAIADALVCSEVMIINWTAAEKPPNAQIN